MDGVRRLAWRPVEACDLVGQSVLVALLKAVQSGLMLAALALAAHWLGAHAYGSFATTLASAGLLAVLAQLGLPQWLLRRVPAAERTAGTARHLLRRSLRAVTGAGAGLAMAAGLLWASTAGTAAFHHLPLGAVALGALAAGPLALLRVLAAWLQARGHPVAAQLGDGLIRPGGLGLAVAGAAGLGLPAGPGTAAWLFIAVLLAAVIVTAWQVRTRERDPAPAARHDTGGLAGMGPLLGIALLHALMANADVLMLGTLAGPTAAGAYHAASRVALTLGLAMAAVGTVVGPHLARHAAGGDRAGLTRLAAASARMLAVPAALALPFVAAAAGPVLGLLGTGFAAGAPALVALWLGQLVNLACGPAAVLLNLYERADAALRGVALGAGANLVLNAVLIPPLGATGAAAATAASTALWNLVLVGRARALTGVDPSVLGRAPRPGAA